MITPISWRTNNGAIQKAGSTINLTKVPQRFTPAENRMNFQFEAIQQQGRQTAKLKLAVIDIVPNQEDLVIENALYSLTLKASIIAGYDQFRTFNTNTPQNLQLIAEDLAYTLLDNKLIAQDYDVYTEGTVVVLEAYSTSRDYNMTITLPSSGLVIQQIIVGIPQYIYEDLIDYNVFADVFVAEGSLGDTIDRSNATYIDSVYSPFYSPFLDFSIESLVNQFVDVVLPSKRLNNTTTYDLLDYKGDLPVSRPYFITYGDSFRMLDKGNRRKLLQGQSEIRYVINGALDRLNTYDLEPFVLDVESSNTTKFMTSLPEGKLVSYASHEYLALYAKANTNVNDIYLSVDVRFNDSTTITYDYPLGQAMELKGVVSFDVSPNALNLPSLSTNNGVDIDYYDVYIKYRPTGTTIDRATAKQRYKMDNKCVNRTSNIIFVNEYGVWDSLNTEGYEIVSISRDQTVFERALPANANEIEAISDEVRKVRRLDSDSTYSLSSGYVSKEQYKWLERLSDSSTAYIWDEDDNAYRHILMDSIEYTFNGRLELGVLTLSFRLTTSNNTITR